MILGLVVVNVLVPLPQKCLFVNVFRNLISVDVVRPIIETRIQGNPFLVEVIGRPVIRMLLVSSRHCFVVSCTHQKRDAGRTSGFTIFLLVICFFDFLLSFINLCLPLFLNYFEFLKCILSLSLFLFPFRLKLAPFLLYPGPKVAARGSRALAIVV